MSDEFGVPGGKTLQSIDEFPGWNRASGFFESVAASKRYKKILDIGGGANPMITSDFALKHGIEYSLLDISQTELDKAPSHYTNKICVDLTAPPSIFSSSVKLREVDMAFSHMFLEHVAEPSRVHANIHGLLRAGGIAIHMYPSDNNLPLLLNRLVPERISTAILRIAQPRRDLSGHVGKFPAFYRMCGNPSRRLHLQMEKLGYEVLLHHSFLGHEYYARLPLLRDLEKTMRGPLIRAGVGLTSAQLLIMRRQ